jgi:hypothetical protein
VSIWPASMELRQSNKMPVMRNNEQQSSSFSKIPFVVRDDTGIRDIVFQTSDTTWHAYNGWHGNSLYGGGGPASDGRAYKVSYNRPIATRDGTGTYAGPPGFFVRGRNRRHPLAGGERFDVCYMAGVDTDRLDPTGQAGQFANYKVFISCGHDEYWSGNQRTNGMSPTTTRV